MSRKTSNFGEVVHETVGNFELDENEFCNFSDQMRRQADTERSRRINL